MAQSHGVLSARLFLLAALATGTPSHDGTAQPGPPNPTVPPISPAGTPPPLSGRASGIPPVQPGVTPNAEPQPVVSDLNKCVSPEDLHDRDGDVHRNLAKLVSDDLCLMQDVFTEGRLRWVLQIIQHKVYPDRWFWFVPHDNENDAFDTAVHAVKKYGGTIVAVETGGNRFNGSQDPNYNFDAGTGLKCRKQVAPSATYTKRVLRWWKPGRPIVALHTNDRGYEGDGRDGVGKISMAKPLPGMFPFKAKAAPLGKSPDDTLIFVASTARPEADAGLREFVARLNQKGVNVLYEPVSPAKNDCSLSNYAALKGIRDYFNVEVVQTDGASQQRIVDILLDVWPDGGIGALEKSPPLSAQPESASPGRTSRSARAGREQETGRRAGGTGPGFG